MGIPPKSPERRAKLRSQLSKALFRFEVSWWILSRDFRPRRIKILMHRIWVQTTHTLSIAFAVENQTNEVVQRQNHASCIHRYSRLSSITTLVHISFWTSHTQTPHTQHKWRGQIQKNLPKEKKNPSGNFTAQWYINLLINIFTPPVLTHAHFKETNFKVFHYNDILTKLLLEKKLSDKKRPSLYNNILFQLLTICCHYSQKHILFAFITFDN